MDNKELKVIADAMLDKKGQDVVSLDLRPIGTAISDYFIVCNADSAPAVVAIADNVEEMMIEKYFFKLLYLSQYLSRLGASHRFPFLTYFFYKNRCVNCIHIKPPNYFF